MHALPVVPEQPGKHRILGLTNGFKPLTVQSLHLQRSEEGFRYRVVLAVAIAAHGWLHAVLIKRLAKVITAYWLLRSLWKIILSLANGAETGPFPALH